MATALAAPIRSRSAVSAVRASTAPASTRIGPETSASPARPCATGATARAIAKACTITHRVDSTESTAVTIT